MTRVADRVRRRALLAPLALLALVACARQEAPRGGTPDRTPPSVISVRPEPLSTVTGEALEQEIRFQFNETISERPASGAMEQAVLVSPETPGARVQHVGDALEVEVPGGLRAGVVYRVTVRPVIRDRFSNTMRAPFELVFSTGGELHETAVAGLLVDRVTGQPVADARVRAVPRLPADTTVVHVARTDSAGLFALRYLPPGSYDLSGFVDVNRSGVAEGSEPRGRFALELAPADTAFANFTLAAPDTTPARLTGAEVVEPAVLRLTFDDFLDPAESLARAGAALERVEGAGDAPAVQQLVHEHRWLELRAAAAAAADTAGGPPAPGARAAATAAFRGRAQGADSTALAALGDPPLTLPSRVVYAQLADSLAPGVDYLLRIQNVPNLAGLLSAPDTARVSRAAPPGGR